MTREGPTVPRHRRRAAIALVCATVVLGAVACSDDDADQDTTAATGTTVTNRTEDAARTVAVFEAGEDGYASFRIPAVVLAGNGDLLAFAEGRVGSSADDGDVDLVVKRSTDDGATWGPLQVVADNGPDFIGNPAPVVDPASGRILVLGITKDGDDTEAEILTGTGEDTNRPFVVTSDDDGATWTEPTDLTEQAKAPPWRWYSTGPGHAIVLERGEHTGRIVVPANHSHPTGGYGAHVITSDDGGATWQIGAVDTPPVGSPRHPNESMAVELGDGTMLFTARDQLGTDRWHRLQTTSSDGGSTFDRPYTDVVGLVAPVVQASILRVEPSDGPEGGVLVFSAPSDAEERVDLRLRLSDDDGDTWTDGLLVAEGPAGYSDLVALPGGALGVLHESGEPGPDGRIDFTAVGVDRLTGP
jgi:sialidase-1